MFGKTSFLDHEKPQVEVSLKKAGKRSEERVMSFLKKTANSQARRRRGKGLVL